MNLLTSSGETLGPEQRITAEEALLAYTREAVKVIGNDGQMGTPEAGKYTDFVVLEESPLEVNPMRIKDIQVIATVMNGEIPYQVDTSGIYHH